MRIDSSRLSTRHLGAATIPPRAWVALAAIGLPLILPLAAVGVAQVLGTAWQQLDGSAATTDFLAYYTGGRLLVEDPAAQYHEAAGPPVAQPHQRGAGVYM